MKTVTLSFPIERQKDRITSRHRTDNDTVAVMRALRKHWPEFARTLSFGPTGDTDAFTVWAWRDPRTKMEEVTLATACIIEVDGSLYVAPEDWYNII